MELQPLNNNGSLGEAPQNGGQIGSKKQAYIKKEEDKRVHAVHEVRICVFKAAVHASDTFRLVFDSLSLLNALISAFNLDM